MFFISKDRVEKDLERIKFANLPIEKQQIILQEKKERQDEMNAIKYDKTDRLAMIIAAFSILGPYILAFLTLISLIMGAMYLFFNR